jgi:methionine biosynthesis protein MetW
MSKDRHNYEYDVDTSSQTAPANVVRLIGRDKNVLEIGCGPGSITKILAEQNACRVTGLELDPEAIKKVMPYCVKVMQADLNSSEWPSILKDERFDIVLVADVLEHLYDPWNSLKRMASLINENGCVVISLPHVGHAAVAGCLLSGDFNYHDWGLLDRTHIRFFGLKNIEDLFAQAELKIIDVRFVTKNPEESEFAGEWAKLSNDIKTTLMSSKHAQVYQVVVKAVPLDREEQAVKLVPPPFRYSPLVGVKPASIKVRIASSLGAKQKAIIRKVADKFGVKL